MDSQAIKEVHAYELSTAPKEMGSEELICSLVKFESGVIGTISDQIGALRNHKIQIVGKKGGLAEVENGNSSVIKYCKEDGLLW